MFKIIGTVHSYLYNFLDENLPKKRKNVLLGVGDSKLGFSIGEVFPKLKCAFTGIVPEIIRGIRTHFEYLAKDLGTHTVHKSELSLGHSFSRSKVIIIFLINF